MKSRPRVKLGNLSGCLQVSGSFVKAL
uniref:Uncharacterized protein n=1 Tax=Arundo donax TaxID=35708 RepID=A0A0A9GVX7_ARUDO